jgi:hypothetical protein
LNPAVLDPELCKLQKTSKLRKYLSQGNENVTNVLLPSDG